MLCKEISCLLPRDFLGQALGSEVGQWSPVGSLRDFHYQYLQSRRRNQTSKKAPEYLLERLQHTLLALIARLSNIPKSPGSIVTPVFSAIYGRIGVL